MDKSNTFAKIYLELALKDALSGEFCRRGGREYEYKAKMCYLSYETMGQRLLRIQDGSLLIRTDGDVMRTPIGDGECHPINKDLYDRIFAALRAQGDRW